MDLFTELRRRNVFKVALVYVVVGWLLVQVADIMTESFGSPDWVMKTFIGFMMLGFPVAVIFAWAFEMTPEGLKRETDVDRSEAPPPSSQKFNYTVIGLLVLALGYFAYQQFFSGITQSGGEEITGQSIAVLPFANRSADEENAAFFADGIHDDLLTVLSRIGDLKVISRTSVERYRGSDKSIPEIAAELGVVSILEGSVQRAGDRVRINAQLINAQTDEHVWAEIYDEKLTAANIFDIQQRIASSIADALHATLSEEDVADIASRPTNNLAAYDAYLKGRELIRHGRTEDLEAAEKLFQQALELDPEFAAAWAELARSRAMVPWYQVDTASSMRLVDIYIDKAFLLEPDLEEAYVARGILRRLSDRFEGAEVAYRRALAINPNNAEALGGYGNLLLDMRRPDEALELLNRALQVDPLSPAINLDIAAGLELVGDYDAALEQYHKTLEIDPKYVWAYLEIGWMYWDLLGRMDEAVDWYLKALEIDPDNSGLLFQLTRLYLDLGDDAAAEKIARRAGEDTLALTWVYLYRDETERAIDYARNLLARNPTDVGALFTLVNVMAFSGQFEETLEMIALRRSDLLEEPEIDSRIDRMSLTIAAALIATGQLERAQHYIDGSSAVLATGMRHAPKGFDLAYDIADVENLALRGETEEALDRLREAIDSGWRSDWWLLHRRPSLSSLRGHPRFEAMVAELETDVAAQSARLEARRQAAN